MCPKCAHFVYRIRKNRDKYEISKSLSKKNERKNGRVYRLDYRVNGVRRRQVIGTNKREVELIQSSIENDLFRGIHNVSSQKKIISFTKLADEYFSIKANNLSNASVTRYKEYLKQFNYFFSKYFQTTFKNITLIKASHITEFIDFLTSRVPMRGEYGRKQQPIATEVFLPVFLSMQLRRNI